CQPEFGADLLDIQRATRFAICKPSLNRLPHIDLIHQVVPRSGLRELLDKTVCFLFNVHRWHASDLADCENVYDYTTPNSNFLLSYCRGLPAMPWPPGGQQCQSPR